MQTTGSSSPSERVDVESLPPAARRKFFSNAEYLRLAQGDRRHGLDHRPNLAKVSCEQPQFLWNRHSFPATHRSIHKKGRLKRALFPGYPHQTSIPQAASLAACPDWQCFHSLPLKIQQSCFSNEERKQLDQICCMGEVLDAADKALFRFEKRRRMSESAGTASISQPSSLCFGTSDVDIYNDMDDMEHTLYACFGRLDEDEELDLALDEYHAHVMDSPSRLPFKRNQSFLRILPFYSTNSGSRPLSTMHHSPNPSQFSAVSEADMTNPTPNSETCPFQGQFNCASRSSTSSIDPSAKYYQDPEARLKLRVYLASPQKFDEAVEFGFPTLKREGLIYPGRDFAQPKIRNPHAGTFPEEGTAFSGGDIKKQQNTPQVSEGIECSQGQQKSLHSSSKRRQWLLGSDSNTWRSPGNREMTLKMTLTRPDLRTDSTTPELPELSPNSSDTPIWESGLNDRGLVKKMWRTLRRQK